MNNKTFDLSRYLAKGYHPQHIIRKKDMSQILGVSLSTIYRWGKNGRLPNAIKSPSGRVIGWFSSDIDNWFDHKNR
ncbi:helix-turn-helix transcriptional regulator [Photobacterium chitinilyticum]|uniref:helix-turn-helix transcriptional regulator n=1 Tax=Photobacterium chitinilyticum TaxID=2485123 RepID=UPI003D0DF155